MSLHLSTRDIITRVEDAAIRAVPPVDGMDPDAYKAAVLRKVEGVTEITGYVSVFGFKRSYRVPVGRDLREGAGKLVAAMPSGVLWARAVALRGA